MSSGKGGGGGIAQKDYFGAVGGIVCAGPVDELVSIVVDGATLWPTRKAWADDIIDIPVIALSRTSNIGTAYFAFPHGLHHGDKFTLTITSADPAYVGTYTIPAANTVTNYIGDRYIRFANTGSNEARHAATGSVDKVVHYSVNDLVRYLGGIWKCNTAHDGTPDKAPPDVSYWDPYSVKRVDVSNPFQLTIAGYGKINFYWGTTDQDYPDYNDVKNYPLAYNGHPPYRRQCMIELLDFLFGTERQGPPNIEAIVRRKPNQSLITGSSASMDSDKQANPAAFAVEVMTDPVFGAGFNSSRLDATTFQALADDLLARSADYYLSPVMDKSDSLRSFISTLLAYYDGWMRFDSGQVKPGRFLHNEALPSFTDATTIDFNDLIEEVHWDAPGWSDTFNEVVCRFQDRQRAFKDAGQMIVSSYNRRVVLEPRRSKLERPWITREAQASSQAAEWSKVYAQPQITGTAVVRSEKVTSIEPGTVFLLTHDAFSISVACRCTSKQIEAPPSGRATVEFTSERGVGSVPFKPTPVSSTALISTALPSAESVTLFQFVQTPPGLVDVSPFQLSVLCARRSELTRKIVTWFKLDDSSNFYDIGEQIHFAVKGILHQDYAAVNSGLDDDSQTLQLDLDADTVTDDLDFVLSSQTDDAIDDDALIIWLFQDADRTQYEICSVKEIVLNSGVYKLKVRRGRFGSKVLDFSTGDHAWVMFRSDLQIYTHRKFQDHAAAGSAATFRLQALNMTQEADVSDTDICPDIAFTFTDLHLPLISWFPLSKKEVADPQYVDCNFSSAFAATTIFRLTVVAQTSSGQISRIKIMARLGSHTIVAGDQSFTPMPSVTFTFIGIKFPQDGTWEVWAEVTEQNGRVSLHGLTQSGSPAVALIGSAAKVQTPILAQVAGPVRKKDISFGLFPAYGMDISSPTAGATVYFSFGTFDPGGAFTGVPNTWLEPDWTNLAGPDWTNTSTFPHTAAIFPVAPAWTGIAGIFTGGGFPNWPIFMIAKKAGKTDSERVRYDFWWQSDS